MKRLAFLAVVGTLVLLMPTVAWADMYSVSGTIASDGTASVDAFDSSKGTLTGVSWTADANIDLSFSITNNSPSTSLTTLVRGQVAFFGFGPDGSNSNDSSVKLSYGIDPINLNGGGSGTFTDNLSGTINWPSSRAILSDYEGTGKADFSYSLVFVIAPGGSGSPLQGDSASLTSDSASFGSGSMVTVTYTFTPDLTATTPEPASLTILGVAAVGMVGYGWRRRKRAAA